MPLHLAAGRRLLLLLAAVATSAASPAVSAAVANGSSSCTTPLPDAEFVRAAFLHVSNFQPPLPGRRACRPVRRLRFPSLNLTGPVDWAALGNLSSLLTVDLSGNSLRGGVDAAFWRAPVLRAVDVSRNNLSGALRFDVDGDPSTRLAALNVSGNRFASVVGLAGLPGLEALDVSRNRIGAAPAGLRNLTKLRRLDLSGNGMAGRFPDDLPLLDGLASLNISRNNFSGIVPAAAVRRFGRSAFFQAGDALRVVDEDSAAPSGGTKRRRAVVVALIAAGACLSILM